MSTSTLPRLRVRDFGLGGYCWHEHPSRRVHCTKPVGHSGPHWHPYSKTSW